LYCDSFSITDPVPTKMAPPSRSDELIGRGVDVADVVDMGGVLFAWFSDPDGHTWSLQEMENMRAVPDVDPSRLP
jgi:hypothetical protein